MDDLSKLSLDQLNEFIKTQAAVDRAKALYDHTRAGYEANVKKVSKAKKKARKKGKLSSRARKKNR